MGTDIISENFNVAIPEDLDVVIGISTYNDYEMLGNLLQSIRWHSGTFKGTYAIVVCDDGTPDYPVGGESTYHKELERVCHKFGVTLIKHGNNLGIPATWNHLALEPSFAHSKHIIILNNDLIVAPYWLDSMVYFAKNNTEFGGANLPYHHIEARNMGHVLDMINQNAVVQIINPVSRQPIGTDHSQPLGERPGRIMCMSGCNFVVRRDVFDKVGKFDENIISFHEESLKNDRYVVTRDAFLDVCVDTIEDVFDRYSDTKVTKGDREYVYPIGLCALSAEAIAGEDVVVNYHMTPAQRTAFTDAQNGVPQTNTAIALEKTTPSVRSLLKKAKEKVAENHHINKGMWDKIEYIVRHKTSKPMLETRNKFGATMTTPDHSLIVHDGKSLTSAKPLELDGRPLERVWALPEIDQVDEVDLLGYLQDVEGINYDETHIWHVPKSYRTGEPELPVYLLRRVTAGTPMMDALCRLIGDYVSEGSVSYMPDGWSSRTVVVCSQDRRVVDKCAEDFCWLFTAEPRYATDKKNGYKDVHAMVSGYRIVAKLFEGMCGRGSKNKRLPKFVFRLPEEHQWQVFQSLLRGDGYTIDHTDNYVMNNERSEYYKENYWLYTTSSRGLISDLSVLATIFGHKFTVGYRESVDAYWIRRSVKFYGPRSWEPVVKEVEGSEYVYDLGTQDTHMFTDAEGLILVHNSDWGTRAAAEHKYPSWALPWPHIYHVWGHTFANNEKALQPGKRMDESRKIYCDKWNVPPEFRNTPFEFTDPLYMSQIPSKEVKWLLGDVDRAIVDADTGEFTVPEPAVSKRSFKED